MEDVGCLLAGGTFIDSNGGAQGECSDWLGPPPLCSRRRYRLEESTLPHPVVINKFSSVGIGGKREREGALDSTNTIVYHSCGGTGLHIVPNGVWENNNTFLTSL